ncbi:MAG: Na/Pi cotransporter family protein [Oscillospiraceae bacterium]
MGLSNVISLLGGVALFLFGMTLMGDGLKNVAGSKLELVLYKLTSSPWKGLLLGTAVTAVIQSSSATSVMVVGFVNSGMMQFRQAIGIVLGATLGTSVTGWIICLSDLGAGGGWISLLSTATLTGVIAVVGIILRMFCKSPVKHHVGDILMGFAVLMFGMSAMSGSMAPLKENEEFIRILTSFSNPLLGILVGAAFTAVLQSASAAVGIVQALAGTGALTFSAAFPLLMGIGIGAAVPVLLSALGANINGKRTAFVYLLIEVLGVVVFGPVVYGINAVFPLPFMDMAMTTAGIAALNSLFRLATLLVLAPCIGLMDRLSCLVIKDKPEASLPDMERLEERFLQHPALAIEQSRTVINSMAQKAQENLFEAFALLENYSDAGFARVAELEAIVDRYEDKLGTYLVSISQRELSSKQNEDMCEFLHTISDFERISDHALNIAETAREIHQKNLVFSDAAARELSVMQRAVSEIVSISVQAFQDKDLDCARRVEPLEELIDSLCDEMKLHHIDRLQKGICTLHQGFVFNDLLTNYERVSDHCSNIAVALIELDSDAFDTHEYLKSLREMRDSAFARYFEEYRQKYTLDSPAPASSRET